MGRRGTTVGIAALVVMVPVGVSLAMSVPGVGGPSAAAGAVTDARPFVDSADPQNLVATSDPLTDPAGAPDPVAATGDSAMADTCGSGPAGAQAVAPPGCAVSEPPAAAAVVPAGGAVLPASTTSAVAGSVFDAGNIISDAVFNDSSAMTDAQIAGFIAAQGASCSGAFCLKNLRVTVPALPADEFCSAVAAGASDSAALLIGKVSRACGVNPQVMLVTLEKESGLLDNPGPAASRYDAAYGWHCPDTGPGGSANCDPAYAGLVNQTYGMAKQWARYRVHPEKYNYRAGQTVNILWNVVESGCGGAPVTIANTATASLYNYTPYQPNPASLAAYPGVGDACSSYGNRNFFFLFQRYFGSTGGGTTGIVVSTVGVRTATTGVPAAAVPTPVTVPVNSFVAAGIAGRTITAPTPAVAAGLQAGFAALGLPYVWGGGGSGAGPNNGCARGGGQYNSCGSQVGFDCSGLTAFVLGQAGFTIPGDSLGQRSSGIAVGWDQALPGDIVGYPGHVAMYLGAVDGVRYILEASWVGIPVHVVRLTRTDADATVYRYWAALPGTGVSTAGVSLAGLAGSGQAPTSGPRTYTPNLPPLTITSVAAPQPSAAAPADPTTTVRTPTSAASPQSGSVSSGPSSSTGVTPTGSTVNSTVPSGTTTTPTTGQVTTGATPTTRTSGSSTGTTATSSAGSTPSTRTPATSSTSTTPTTGLSAASSTAVSRTAASSTSASRTAASSTAASSTAASSTAASSTASTTSASTTALSTSLGPVATPALCPQNPPPPPPPPTSAATPTLPPPAAANNPPAASTPSSTAGIPASSTFAALIQSLTDNPCG